MIFLSNIVFSFLVVLKPFQALKFVSFVFDVLNLRLNLILLLKLIVNILLNSFLLLFDLLDHLWEAVVIWKRVYLQLRTFCFFKNFTNLTLIPITLFKVDVRGVGDLGLQFSVPVFKVVFPVAFELLQFKFLGWAVFLSKSVSFTFKVVSFVDYLSLEVFVSTETIVLTILKHAMVDVVVSLLNSISRLVTTVELPCINIVVGSIMHELAVSSHLTINPLTLISLSSGKHQLHSDAIFLIFLNLTFVNIPVVVLDLTNPLDWVVIPKPLINSTALIDQPSNPMLD